MRLLDDKLKQDWFYAPAGFKAALRDICLSAEDKNQDI